MSGCHDSSGIDGAGSVIVSFAFGAMLMKEKNLRSKAIDLFFVLLGMICLFIGSR